MSKNRSNSNLVLPLAILGVFASPFLYFAVLMVVFKAQCGAALKPETWIPMLAFLFTNDSSTVSTPGVQCTPSASAIWFSLLGTIALIIGVVWYAIYRRNRYKQSDEFFIKDVSHRDGIARGPEVRANFGSRRTLKKADTIRPSMGKKKVTQESSSSELQGNSTKSEVQEAKPRCTDVALWAGTSAGSDVWMLLEESILLIGAPRSGKGVHLVIPMILDSPGAVITTSTRADNYANTHLGRKEKGSKVTLFDPQGLTGQQSTLKWSPIAGCENPLTAQQRADSLISATGLGKGGSNEEWRAPAVLILQALLHAAAVGNQGIDELIRWGNDMSAARQAVEILKSNPRAAKGWGGALSDVIEGDAKMSSSKWFGVSNVMLGLTVPQVREVMNPRTPEETFDIDDFILNRGTLYLVGTKTGGGSVGAFLIAMLDAITERAREIAAKLPGNRLDPPMTLVLDEIANIAGSWPGLATLMADGGGVGIVPVPVFQSMAQARNHWGVEAAASIFDASTVKILLGGSANNEDLRQFSTLIGTREVNKQSETWGSGQSSKSSQSQEVDVLTVAELRRIPFGYGLMLGRTGRPAFLQMKGYWKRKDADQIKASKAAYDPSALEAIEAKAASENEERLEREKVY